MLSEITLEIPEADPYFRTAEEIEKAKNFHTNHGAEFCWKIAKAVNVVAHLRPHDPIAPICTSHKRWLIDSFTLLYFTRNFFINPFE